MDSSIVPFNSIDVIIGYARYSGVQEQGAKDRSVDDYFKSKIVVTEPGKATLFYAISHSSSLQLETKVAPPKEFESLLQP